MNTRNGYSSKTVKSSGGEMEINVPRDREGSFEPQVIKKYEKDLSNIENQIISILENYLLYLYYLILQ